MRDSNPRPHRQSVYPKMRGFGLIAAVAGKARLSRKAVMIFIG